MDVKSTKGLKKEEVEKGIHGTAVELPFIPIQDEEAQSTAKDITVKLPNDTKTTITEIAKSANRELFLTRSIIGKKYVEKDLGLYAEAEEHEKEMEKCQINIALAPHVADVSPTCRRHHQMSPNLGRHCVSFRHRRGPDTPNLCQLQPTSISQSKHTS